MPPRRGPGVCECGDVQMVPHDVVLACAAAVDLHRDTVAALIPQDVASTLWRIATTTEPIVTGGPASVLSALEQLLADMVEEARMAVGGHLPEIQVPPSAGCSDQSPCRAGWAESTILGGQLKPLSSSRRTTSVRWRPSAYRSCCRSCST